MNLCHPIELPDPTPDKFNQSDYKGLIINSTTVAINHLRIKHSISKEVFLSKYKSTIPPQVGSEELQVGSLTLPLSVTTQTTLTKHTIKPLIEIEQGWLNVSYVLNVVCRDLRPQSQIEGEGIRQFIDDLNSSYVATSHTWVANILDQIGKLVLGLIRDKLSVYLLRTSYFR